MVVRVPRTAHCLLVLHRIGEVDWDATFNDFERFCFRLWLPYNFATGEVDQLVEFTSLRLNSTVYAAVQCEVRHASPYIA